MSSTMIAGARGIFVKGEKNVAYVRSVTLVDSIASMKMRDIRTVKDFRLGELPGAVLKIVHPKEMTHLHTLNVHNVSQSVDGEFISVSEMAEDDILNKLTD